MKRKIIFKVNRQGKIQMEAMNFQGESCKEATRKFANLLGAEEHEELKPEFFETHSHTENENA